MKLKIILFSVLLVFTQFVNAVNMRGYVRDRFGQPVAGVSVSPVGRINSTKTDEKGFFNFEIGIKLDKEVVFFDKISENNWHFKVEIFENLDEELNVILNIDQDYEVRQIPHCTNLKNKKNRLIEGIITLSVPKSYKYESGIYEHGNYSRIRFKDKEGTHWLTRDNGYFTRVYPQSQSIILNSEHYQIRRTSVGLDWQGNTKTGGYWRYFGSVFESYFYLSESKEAVNVFNGFLDNACF